MLEAIPHEWVHGAPSPVPQPIVIPSIPFSDYLQLRIAHRFGVCMGLDFLTSRDFIFRALGQRGEEAWSRRFLTWRLLPHMADHAALLGVNDPTTRDRFALAEMVADRFDQYGHFRPEMIKAWANGKSVFARAEMERELSAERWQRELWRKLRAASGEAHPAERFERLGADADFRSQLVERFPRLLVLGSGVLDPLLVQTLDLLASAGGEVEVHVILPSLEFLGDLRARKALPPVDQSPEAMIAGAGHPLLESMGRQSIGAFLLLGRLDDQYTHWPVPETIGPDRRHLLARLQADIRALRPPAAESRDPADISIRVHSCFGPRREMEVLKDEILRAFQDFPGLRPEDIHVVTPSLEVYAPLVSAALEQGEPPLPVGLMERPAGRGEPRLEAMLSLLEMARGGRYEASWLMELLQLEAVQGALGVLGSDDGVERLRGAIRRSGVTRGLEKGRIGSWEFARDRLIAGRWFGADDGVLYPADSFVLPVAAQLAGDDEGMQGFIDWFAALEETMTTWETPIAAPGWAKRLEDADVRLFDADEDASLALRPHLEFLCNVDGSEVLDAGTMADWLSAESAEAGRRAHVSGRIAFGRLKQLQNIPCRVLAMVGFQEGAFPGQDRPPAWDLLGKAPRIWDRNLRVDDRQLFLDALLTPRDRLIITASARNVRTRKTEPFSSCVDELLRVAVRMGADRESLVVEHRLQPFAADYFASPTAVPRSFSPQFAQVASRLARSSVEKRQPFSAETGATFLGGMGEVSLPQLVAFWQNPARAFLQAQGIRLPRDADDDEALDRAAVTLDGLAAWKLKDAVIAELAVGQGNLPRTEAALRANRGLPPGHLGAAVWRAQRALAEPLGAALREWCGGSEALEVSLADGLTIAGVIPLTRPGDQLLAWQASEFKTPKHFLKPWVVAVFAAAGGRSLPTVLLDPAATERPRERAAIPAEDARAFLHRLVEGFHQGISRPLAYAPETSRVLEKALREKSVKDALATAADAWEKEDWGAAGEGTTTEARWAWRDRDPFEQGEEWCDWARRIAAPLGDWGGLA